MTNIGAVAQLACLLEAAAPKPGNVSPGRSFANTHYEDFLASAAAVGAPLSGAGTRGVGATIRLAIEATTEWTRANTNLGIVLLLAPLARAASRTPSVDDLRDTLRTVIGETTVEDARDMYVAIRRAAPGGLGRVESQDVAHEPTVTLLEAMRLAADRDTIAQEYVTAFEMTFETGVPALTRARRAGLSWNDAIVETFLTLLSAVPDTHIARRGGGAVAADVSRRAMDVLVKGGVRSEDGRRAVDAFDAVLRQDGNLRNPGTTADLTAAAIFVVLLNGGWHAAPR